MKRIKKIGRLLLAGIMICSMCFTGCGTKKEDSTEKSISESRSEVQKEKLPGSLAGIKIGMTLFVNEGLFATMYDYVSTLAEAVGVELINDVGAFTPEDQIASVENLIAAGCDGIIYCNFGEDSLTKITQICDEAGVYWVQYCRQIVDKDIEDVLNSSKYYVGRTVEDDYQVGINIAKEFKEKGITKTAIVGTTPGDSTTDSVDEGYKEKAVEYGIEICAEVRNCEDGDDCTKAVEIILASYPDTEGIVVLSGSTGKLEGVLKGLENKGKLGEVAVGSLDATDNISEDMEKGYISICHTGNYVDPGFSFALLLNAVAGTPLSEEKIVIADQHVVLRSKADTENFAKYVENTKDHIYAYTGEEFRQWLKVYNPEASVEMIQEAASNYGVEDVMERHNLK